MGYLPVKTHTVIVGSYPGSPQIDYSSGPSFPRKLDFTMGVSGGTNKVAISFDGVNDHLILSDGHTGQELCAPGVKKVWLRNISGASNAVYIASQDH